MNYISNGQIAKPAFNAVMQETKAYVEQKSQRRDELLRGLDEVRSDVHKSSLLPLYDKLLANTDIEQVLQNKSFPGFSQVHCGRTAMKTFYEESYGQGYPAQSTPVNLANSVFFWIENHNELCLTAISILKLLQPYIHQLKAVVDRLEKLSKFEGDPLREGIANFGADVANELDRLQANEERTIPVGPPGSGMFMRMVRCETDEKKFDLFLYNAGLDATLKQGVTPSTLPLYVFEAVPASQLYYTRKNGELSSPFLTELTAITVRKVTGANAEHVLNFFEPINGYRVAADKHMVNFIRCMRANFSSHNSLKALLLHLCGDDRRAYKRLNMDSRLLTLVVEYKHHEKHLDDPALAPIRAQLRIGANNLLKSVYKYAQQDQNDEPVLTEQEAKRLLGTALEVLEGVNKADEAARKSQQADTEAKVFEKDINTTNANAVDAVNYFCRHSHPKIDDGTLTPSIPKSKSFPIASSHPKELVKSLNGLKSFLETFKLDIQIMGAGQQTSAKKLSLQADGLSAVEQFIAQLPLRPIHIRTSFHK